MSGTLITSNDPKGRHATDLFRSAYNNACLDEKRAQRLNEHGGDLQKGIGELIARITVGKPMGEIATLVSALMLSNDTSKFTEENFPFQPEDSSNDKEYRLFDLRNWQITSDEEIAIIMSTEGGGYRPPTPREMMRWGIAHWDGKRWVAGLVAPPSQFIEKGAAMIFNGRELNGGRRNLEMVKCPPHGWATDLVAFLGVRSTLIR